MIHGPSNVKLLFYICKLVLMLFVIFPSKKTSLKMAIIGGRNMWEAYDVCSLINSHILYTLVGFILIIILRCRTYFISSDVCLFVCLFVT